jgi:hypothetical protein
MYGTGSPQLRPAGRGTVIGLRVLFSVLPVVTLGVAAWGSVLRLALLRRRTLDWALLPIVAVLGIGGFVLVGVSDEDSTQSNVGVSGIFVCMLAVPLYYLVADILWHSPSRPQQPPVYAPHMNPYASGPVPRPMTGPMTGPVTGSMTGPVAGAGTSGAHGPVPGPISGPPAAHGMAGMTGQSPYGSGSGPVPPAQPPASGSGAGGGSGPAHPRIDQVRAELDELSDFLRKEDGR